MSEVDAAQEDFDRRVTDGSAQRLLSCRTRYMCKMPEGAG